MSIAFYIMCFLFICSVAMFIWMRWRMNASRGRFALSVVSSLLTCFLTGIAASTSTLPASLLSKVSETMGYGPIESNVPNWMVIILTVGAMILIYRFGVVTIKSWEAPPRVSEINLIERDLGNNIPALFLAQIKLLVSMQSDPIANETVVNWNKKPPPVPLPVSVHGLLRDMLTAAFNEIRIPEDNWHDDGEYWVGETLGLYSDDSISTIVFVGQTYPTEDEIKKRLEILEGKFENLEGFKFHFVYISDEGRETKECEFRVLERAISAYSSRDLIQKSLDLQFYAREIIDRFENTKVGGTTTTLMDSFVELDVSISTKTNSSIQLSQSICEWLDTKTNEHIALTGDYGQGKSTALLKFCYDWAKTFVKTGVIGERVPLLIELRGQSPSETDPVGFLSQWCARYHLLPQQVFNLIKAGDAVVIFEGFDELRNAGRAFYRHQHFNALWRFAYPGTKIIFTGRPNFFIDQSETNRTLRTEETRKVSGDVFTSVWELKKLEPNQINRACRSYDEVVRIGIGEAVALSREFLEIVSRPSMLPVVATIWSDIQELQETGVTFSSGILIEKYIQAVFSRKEVELERDRVERDSPTGSRYLILPKQVREFLTICVAWRMSGLMAKNTIPRSEISDMIRELYDQLFTISKSAGVSPSIVEGLTEFEKRFAEESIDERVDAITSEICSAGLLVKDAAGGATNLSFPHKQFFEFLIAKGAVIRLESKQLEASKLLEKSSNSKEVILRFHSEPNSIIYFADCIGVNIHKFVPKITCTMMRFLYKFTISTLVLLKMVKKVDLKSSLLPSVENDIAKKGGGIQLSIELFRILVKMQC